ncbi:MAG: hypothetical protein ABWY26_03090 [Microbacterium sp.]
MADDWTDYFDGAVSSFTNEFASQGASRLFDTMFRTGSDSNPLRLDVAPLAESLNLIHGTSQEILDVLRHPTRTAADELLDRAQHAYTNAWYEEALGDADRSINAYPYQAAAHLLKALAAFALGRSDEAVAGLLGAVRYGVDAELPIATTATLLLADFTDAGESTQSAISLLEGFRIRRGEVPEILLALHLRAPHDDGYFQAVLAALARAGLSLDRVHPPVGLHGLTARLDAYLDVEIPRELERVANERAALALAAQANVALSRLVPFDPWLIQDVSAVIRAALPGPHRPAWSVRELAWGFGVPIGANWLNDYADFARWLRLRVDEHARARVALAPPGFPLADLTPVVATLDEIIALHAAWARVAAAGREIPSAVVTGAGGEVILTRPAFVVPLALRTLHSPMFSVADLVANAVPRPPAVPVVDLRQAKHTVAGARFTISRPAQRWEVIVNTTTDSVALVGGPEPIVQPLRAGGLVDLPLVIDGGLHALRVSRDQQSGSECTLSLDGEPVGAVRR